MSPGAVTTSTPKPKRQAVLAAFPRERNFKSSIIDAFYQGMKHRPDSTFGTFNDDFPRLQESAFPSGGHVRGDPRIEVARMILPSER
jgi:hypothetical protein